MSGEEYTVFCRNIADKVTEPILFELFLQAGPVDDVRIPMQDGKSRNFAFIVFKHKCSVKYALELFRDTKLYGKSIILQNRALEEAERQAERNYSRQATWRNDQINSLRGGPISGFSNFNSENMVGGANADFKMDDMNPLRGGAISFSRMGNMTPKDYSNSSRQFSNKRERPSMSLDSRFANPYSSFPPADLRDSLNQFRSRSQNDRSDRHNWDGHSDRDRSRFDRDGSKHSRDFDRMSERDRSVNRERYRRSRSRDRSSHRNNRQRRR